MIILHPRIHTLSKDLMRPENPWGTVEALQILDGRVVRAGARAEVLRHRAAGEPVEAIDGACVLPGLIDTHAHLTGLSMRPGALDLPDDLPPLQWAEAVAAAAAGLSPGVWITGRAWNQAVWRDEDCQGLRRSPEGFPAHDLLSAAAPDNPVVLHRTDQHAAWVNAAALRAAGVHRHLPDPEGGLIVRDPAGEPLGVLVDEAVGLVARALPPLDAAQRRALLAEKGRLFLSRGVTTVHCALIKPEDLDHYAHVLTGDERLGLRVRGMVYDEPAALEAWARQNKPWRDEGGWWSVETLKAFADGALGSRGAWFFDPYEGATACGFSVATPPEIEALGRAALAGGWQLATHAIGDRAITETIDAYARAGWTADLSDRLRWRVEHVQHPRLDALDKMAALGLFAAMQPIHATRDMRFVAALLGHQRASLSYPWRAVADRGIPTGFGSDYPIETLDPFAGLHAALTRQDEAGRPDGGWFPEHRLGRLEAMLAYTRGGAGLMGRDRDDLGHLGPEAHADLIALDVDPSQDAPEALLRVHVQRVWTAGQELAL